MPDNVKEFVANHDTEVKTVAGLSLIALAIGTKGMGRLASVADNAVAGRVLGTAHGVVPDAAVAKNVTVVAKGLSDVVSESVGATRGTPIAALLRAPGTEMFRLLFFVPEKQVAALLRPRPIEAVHESATARPLAALLRSPTSEATALEPASSSTKQLAWLLKSRD